VEVNCTEDITDTVITMPAAIMATIVGRKVASPSEAAAQESLSDSKANCNQVTSSAPSGTRRAESFLIEVPFKVVVFGLQTSNTAKTTQLNQPATSLPTGALETVFLDIMPFLKDRAASAVPINAK
jgi:hypothetical protein